VLAQLARVDLADAGAGHVLADEAAQALAGPRQVLHLRDIGGAGAVLGVEITLAVLELDDDLAGVDVVGNDAGILAVVP
jgi:hypothetical protein